MADDPDFARDLQPLPRSMRWTAFLAFLVGLRAQTNGGAIATTLRVRRTQPALVAVFALAGIVALAAAPQVAPWNLIGVVILVVVGCIAAAVLVDGIRWQPGAIYFGNFKRDPAAPDGEGAVLLAALCERADDQGEWLCLHTKEEWRVEYFERFGFVEVRRGSKRVAMRRPPSRPSVGGSRTD